MKYIAFMRAVNVAGHARIEMDDVRKAFVAAGCGKVKTFIQSGNVIFESPPRDASAILRRVRARLRLALGEEPVILMRTAAEIADVVRCAPFEVVEREAGVKRYVAFLSRRPRSRPRLPLVSTKEALEAIAMGTREVFVVSRRKPNGFFGIPNTFVEGALGVAATTRNWSTIARIGELLVADEHPDSVARARSRS
jgi:uncharacterized protein (DUF1697 family)